MGDDIHEEHPALGASSWILWRQKFQLVFKVRNRGVRPAFTWAEYNKLWRALIKWQDERGDNPERSYTRALLRDYVLVLANSGIRVGEANELHVGNVCATIDKKGRKVMN